MMMQGRWCWPLCLLLLGQLAGLAEPGDGAGTGGLDALLLAAGGGGGGGGAAAVAGRLGEIPLAAAPQSQPTIGVGAAEGEQWERARRRAQFGAPALQVYNGEQSGDLDPPRLFLSAVQRVVDDTGRGFRDWNVTDQVYTLGHTFTGIMVDTVNLTVAGTDLALGGDDGEPYSNTTKAEFHYKVTECAQRFCTDMPAGFDGRNAMPTIKDRGVSDGILSGNSSTFITRHGFLLIEVFEVIVDVSKRDEKWTPESDADLVKMGPVVYTNVTVLAGVSAPIFDPPQDFFSGPVNVSLETTTDEAHVFYTLQPPFINDENGTWCPHMGSWCTGFPQGQTFHAVPDQPPDYIYSRRGLFNLLFGVPAEHRFNDSLVPPQFPFEVDWATLGKEQGNDLFLARLANKMSLLNSTVTPSTGGTSNRRRMQFGFGGFGLNPGGAGVPGGVGFGAPAAPAAQPAAATATQTVEEEVVFVDPWEGIVPYFEENMTLYPLFTIEKPSGMWLLFEPQTSSTVEHFQVRVSTCVNVTYNTTKTVTSQRMVTEVNRFNVAIERVEDYQLNITVNRTTAVCETVMSVPAANPCPWSRDCSLLGEVSFKLRAYALRVGWVDSLTASGLYTFIQSGFPRWMNTRDDCGGWRQSSAHPNIKYAVSEHTVWDVLAPYDCPPGYHWASTAEGVELLGYDGQHDVSWANMSAQSGEWKVGLKTEKARRLAEKQHREARLNRHSGHDTERVYSNQCGWKESRWENKHRRYFRFSDSGPRYSQFMPASGVHWPDEMHLVSGSRPSSAGVAAGDTEVYRSHVTAWYWYQHSEDFMLSPPYELPNLYDGPTNATWATKAADSLDYLGLEMWTGDNQGHQAKFAGAVCRTNGDWTPPRVVILGAVTVTLEVRTPYVEYGAQAWDPVDDVWYPQWKQLDGNLDDLDDGIVRITGAVDYHKPGIYHIYYDATDLHGNKAVQQVRTIFILDRTIPVLTVTTGVHQRVCEPWTERNCSSPDVANSYDRLITQPCPSLHTCATQPGGFLNPRGHRTQGPEITIEAGTKYVELGATATDNLKEAATLTETIVTKAVGPLHNFMSVVRVYPVYPDFYMINMAVDAYRTKAEDEGFEGEVTVEMVRDLGLIEDGAVFAQRMFTQCRAGEGMSQAGRPFVKTEVWRPRYNGTSPAYCDFEWQTYQYGVQPNIEILTEPLVFNITNVTIDYFDGYTFPSTLNKEQPHVEFDYVNFELPGVYNVTYDVSDDFNNTARTVSRTVTVKDTTPPVLHLLGEPMMTVRYGDKFEDPGAMATDLGDDYYYNLNRANRSECYHRMCTTEHPEASINEKIVTRVHHERLDCETVRLYPHRNKTSPPICQRVESGGTMTITCPVQGTVIKGYTFVGFGQPEGECYNPDVPLRATETCRIRKQLPSELVPADEAVFTQVCIGKAHCELQANFNFFKPDPAFSPRDPCPEQPQWLIVEALCDYPNLPTPLESYVQCRDESVQMPQLGLSGLPPLLGELDHTLPGTRPGQYPLDRFGGTWKNMDDFLSRLDPDLAKLNEKFAHQDVWGATNKFLRYRQHIAVDCSVAHLDESLCKNMPTCLWDEDSEQCTLDPTEPTTALRVNTTVNTTVLGLYIITYDVTDMAGNEATQISRFVIVQDDSELYQNSIQQVYDGTPGTFTGGELPHEVGGTIRVASTNDLVELSKNRPTVASSIWGVHTPSSAAVDGLYANAYLEPFLPMDSYGRTLAQDHIPNIFMSGPSEWDSPNPPTAQQWWRVHLSSNTDKPTVVIYTRDCCTDQFGGKLNIFIGDTDVAPSFDFGGNFIASLSVGLTLCGTMAGILPDDRVEVVCEGSGEYLFVTGGPYIHFAEVEVYGFGGGHGHGHSSAAHMHEGRRPDVGLHHNGAQYAITVPVANVSTSWWVGVPFVTGRQLVLELNTTWPEEIRHVRANIFHAVPGGAQNGSAVWNVSATGEQRRAKDGFVYEGPSAHTSFIVHEPRDDQYVDGRIKYLLQYKELPPTNGVYDPAAANSDCVCDNDLALYEGIPCERQCPVDLSKPRLFNIVTETKLELYLEPERRRLEEEEEEEEGEWTYITRVTADIPLEYASPFNAWGRAWVASTLKLHSDYVFEFQAAGQENWRNIEFSAEPESSLTLETHPTGVARAVIGCGPRDDDLREGQYFISVSAEPVVESDSVLRPTSGAITDNIYTQSVAEAKYHAVPYSLRATFIEPILLPSAVDVVATISHNITTLYYFETYLNQKVALELAGPEEAEASVTAVLSFGECADRDDDWGYRGKGRLQTYKAQSNRPPGYDFLSLCPFELDAGRYYVEVRSRAAADYSLRLSEYTPYCPNNCTGSREQGRCDCTILRCICEPGFFGDDCSIHPASAAVDSYPFMGKSTTLDHHGGGEPGQGTLFNLTCPRGHVVVGLTGSYYDYHNPRVTTSKLVRRVDLLCQPLLAHGVLGTGSNETVVVTNNHSLSIYSRTLSRYSLRQEYLSPEQLDLDCVTPGGKGHLDECRLLHGIWSAQQTIFTEDEKHYAHTCGANEVLVGQTVDVVEMQQTCAEDGVGCSPLVRICNYTIWDHSSNSNSNLTVPCHELCEITVAVNASAQNGTVQNHWQLVLCNTSHNATSPWALDEQGRYWPGNDWDWRSQKYFGDYENDYYATFRNGDVLRGGMASDMRRVARDLLVAGSDFHGNWHYEEPGGVAVPDPCSGAPQERCLTLSGCTYDFGAGSCEGASMRAQGRRLRAWETARRLQAAAAAAALAGGAAAWPNISSNATVIAQVPLPSIYEYVTEVPSREHRYVAQHYLD
jgi:hypothetical protein